MEEEFNARKSFIMADLIVSMYWNNIRPETVSYQKKVFRSLGSEIEQIVADDVDHGTFIDETMSSLPEGDSVLFVDIDCFPLNAAVIEKALQSAREGKLFGCAQSANHINPNLIYAGPMFLAISKNTWEALGRPSAKLTPSCDVAQNFSIQAGAAAKEVELLYPTISILPKWKLGNSHLFGIGTFYEGKVFHLFESHVSQYGFIMEEVAQSVCSNKEIDFLSLMKRAQFASHFEGTHKLLKRIGF